MAGIGALMNGGPDQPAIITGVFEAMLYTGRHKESIARFQFYGCAVYVECTLSVQHVEDFMLMSMGMDRKFLARQET